MASSPQRSTLKVVENVSDTELLGLLRHLRNADTEPSHERLTKWMSRHHVTTKGVAVRDLGGGLGNGIVATASLSEYQEGTVMITVPKELLLGREFVLHQAIEDQHLAEVLAACGEQDETGFNIEPRTAAVLFLLVQLTRLSPIAHDMWEGIKENPWTEYLHYFIPDNHDVPTRWTEQERECLWGTSLARLASNKVRILRREFEKIKHNTEDIPWCKAIWWGENGCLSFEEYLFVEAGWRSRAMDLERKGTDGVDLGECLVPVLDMANHDDGDAYIARWGLDAQSDDAQLTLEFGRYIYEDHEITINYGTDRTAADMLLTYGFLEEDNIHSRGIDLFLPGDHKLATSDPLAQTKAELLGLKPVIHIRADGFDNFQIESHALYALILREGDGLTLETFNIPDADIEVEAIAFDGEPLGTAGDFMDAVRASPLFAQFTLRFHQELHNFLEEIVAERMNLCSRPKDLRLPEGVSETSRANILAKTLRFQELVLLHKAVAYCKARIKELEAGDGSGQLDEHKHEVGASMNSNVLSLPDNTKSLSPSRVNLHDTKEKDVASDNPADSDQSHNPLPHTAESTYEKPAIDALRASALKIDQTASASIEEVPEHQECNATRTDGGEGKVSSDTGAEDNVEVHDECKSTTEDSATKDSKTNFPRMVFTTQDHERSRAKVRTEYLDLRMQEVKLAEKLEWRT